MATWQDLIGPYREGENSGAIHLLLSDKRLIRLALAWANSPKVLGPPPEGADLDALWALTRIDYPALAEDSGLSPGLVLSGFQTLKRHWVIFPDGSVHKAVKNIVGGLATIALKVRPPAPPKPQTPENPGKRRLDLN